MKHVFSVIGVLLLVATMIFNLKLSHNSNDQKVSLAYVKNVAQADDEEGGATYSSMEESEGTETVTVTKGDVSCSETRNFFRRTCMGSGNLSCTAAYNYSVSSTDCPK